MATDSPPEQILSPEEWTAYLHHLGVIAYGWAVIETTIDMAVSIVFHRLGGNKFNSKMPRHPDQAILMIRNCFENNPSVKHIAENGTDLIKKIEQTSEPRNFYVHCIAGKVLRKTIRATDMYREATKDLDLREMEKFSRGLTFLGMQWATFVNDDLLPIAIPKS